MEIVRLRNRETTSRQRIPSAAGPHQPTRLLLVSKICGVAAVVVGIISKIMIVAR